MSVRQILIIVTSMLTVLILLVHTHVGVVLDILEMEKLVMVRH